MNEKQSDGRSGRSGRKAEGWQLSGESGDDGGG